MFWQKRDKADKTQQEELQESVDLLAQAAADNTETNIMVFDVLGRLVDNVTELKQENARLRLVLEQQSLFLQKIAKDTENTQRVLINQEKRLKLLDKRLVENQSSPAPEGQEQFLDQFLERQGVQLGKQFEELESSLFDQLKKILKQPSPQLLPPGSSDQGASKKK